MFTLSAALFRDVTHEVCNVMWHQGYMYVHVITMLGWGTCILWEEWVRSAWYWIFYESNCQVYKRWTRYLFCLVEENFECEQDIIVWLYYRPQVCHYSVVDLLVRLIVTTVLVVTVHFSVFLFFLLWAGTSQSWKPCLINPPPPPPFYFGCIDSLKFHTSHVPSPMYCNPPFKFPAYVRAWYICAVKHKLPIHITCSRHWSQFFTYMSLQKWYYCTHRHITLTKIKEWGYGLRDDTCEVCQYCSD